MRTQTTVATGKRRGIVVAVSHEKDAEHPIELDTLDGGGMVLDAVDAEWLAKKLVKAAKIARKL